MRGVELVLGGYCEGWGSVRGAGLGAGHFVLS